MTAKHLCTQMARGSIIVIPTAINTQQTFPLSPKATINQLQFLLVESSEHNLSWALQCPFAVKKSRYEDLEACLKTLFNLGLIDLIDLI